jgi:hypothetical protein
VEWDDAMVGQKKIQSCTHVPFFSVPCEPILI